jgi:pyruvate,orthophosphate dikinase
MRRGRSTQPTTDDIAALAVCHGLLTATGDRGSHAAVVARQYRVVCVLYCPVPATDADAGIVRIVQRLFGDGVEDEDEITIDGGSGRIYAGAVPWAEERPTDSVRRVRSRQRDAGRGPGPHTLR